MERVSLSPSGRRLEVSRIFPCPRLGPLPDFTAFVTCKVRWLWSTLPPSWYMSWRLLCKLEVCTVVLPVESLCEHMGTWRVSGRTGKIESATDQAGVVALLSMMKHRSVSTVRQDSMTDVLKRHDFAKKKRYSNA